MLTLDIYTIDYFINKFNAIPEEQWSILDFKGPRASQYCALGHCGADWANSTDQSRALTNIFLSKINCQTALADVNDGRNMMFKQKTPKQRIIAALEWIKNETA